MIKRVTIACAVILLTLFGFLPELASAHVLKTDGTIGAVLHILPDDNPESGKATTYELEFSDTLGQFTISKCLCNAALTIGTKVVSGTTLHESGPLSSVNNIAFPTANVYTLRVTGTPKKAGEFEPFELDYIVRVEAGTGATMNGSFPPLLAVGFAMLIGLVLLGAYKTGHNT
jgi:hypothetical protein